MNGLFHDDVLKKSSTDNENDKGEDELATQTDFLKWDLKLS